jgi:two-component system response regulator TctD
MQRYKLLLVEDEPALAGLLGRFLDRGGFDVICCTDGADALSTWDGSFTMAVVDLGLPDMPGEELVSQLLDRAGGPVVVSSGTPVDVRFWAEHAGRVFVLQKPYLPNELLNLAGKLIHRQVGL